MRAESGRANDRAVLVLGGTGFIGSHLAERLASADRRVRAASKRGVWPWGAPPGGVELVALDLAREDAEDELGRLMTGAGAVVNLAGVLGAPGVRPGVYDDLHAVGAARVAAAARSAAASGSGARPLRLVHVSTTGVLGPTGRTPCDETAGPAPVTPYETSKLAGERAATGARGDGLEVVVVRPGLVYGPRDLHLAPFYRAIARGRYRTVAKGAALWQPIYVEDVARALHLALDAPAAAVDGAILHVAGTERLTVAALAERIAARLGSRIRRPGLPYGAAMVVGGLLEAALAPFGIAPPLTRARVRTMTEDRVYAIDRARERLGFSPQVALDEGIGRAIDWYKRHGEL